MFRESRGPVPVNVGDELDVKIEAVGEKGDGIAKKGGFVLFVPGVKEGEECRIRVTKVLRKVGFAEKVGEAQGAVEPPRARQEKVPDIEPEAPQEDSEEFGEEVSGEEDAEEPGIAEEPEMAEDDEAVEPDSSEVEPEKPEVEPEDTDLDIPEPPEEPEEEESEEKTEE